MNRLVQSASSVVLEAAQDALRTPHLWPDSATGFAHRIFERTATAPPEFMQRPLRHTNGSLLRRTPELAAYGYVLDRADQETVALWADAVEHLRGREIYPSDRQSFIFNPIEILGISAGLISEKLPAEHREWMTNIIMRGISQGQFKTPLSRLAAHAALITIDNAKAKGVPPVMLDAATLATPELIQAAAIGLAFVTPPGVVANFIENVLISRFLDQPIPIGDAAEAATLAVIARRAIDRAAISKGEGTAEEMVLTLCRRFPLFVERLQKRQRSREAFSVTDEYDVQDLLHAILKLHFEDIRPEEYTPSYAGNSSKVDFYLPRERMLIESKMTRANLGQREVVDQLINDVARYSKVPGVDTLICLIYDPDRRCSNPKTIENDVEASGARLKVRAIICPQGL